MNNLSTFSSKAPLTLGGALLTTALSTPLYAHGYYNNPKAVQNGSYAVKSNKTPETFSGVQIRSSPQDMNIDNMIISVFEKMSKESVVTDSEIAKIMSDNMLDLLL